MRLAPGGRRCLSSKGREQPSGRPPASGRACLNDGHARRAGSDAILGREPTELPLVPDAEHAADVAEQTVPLHLVDQRRDERAAGPDQIGEILLGDAAEVDLAAMGAALAVRLAEDEQRL